MSHLRGALGMYLGLTGAQVKGEDNYALGLATHFTTSGDGSVSELFILYCHGLYWLKQF